MNVTERAMCTEAEDRIRQLETRQRITVDDARAWKARALRAEARLAAIRVALDEKGNNADR
jgi:hypothetical protein